MYCCQDHFVLFFKMDLVSHISHHMLFNMVKVILYHPSDVIESKAYLVLSLPPPLSDLIHRYNYYFHKQYSLLTMMCSNVTFIVRSSHLKLVEDI